MVRLDTGGALSPASVHRMPALANGPGSAAKASMADPRFDKLKQEILDHFNQETRSKKRIHELE